MTLAPFYKLENKIIELKDGTKLVFTKRAPREYPDPFKRERRLCPIVEDNGNEESYYLLFSNEVPPQVVAEE